MHVFVPIYKQKLYILKIELFLGIHTILWNKKSAVKCFKCYSEKILHNFVNRLEIGTTIIYLFSQQFSGGGPIHAHVPIHAHP